MDCRIESIRPVLPAIDTSGRTRKTIYGAQLDSFLALATAAEDVGVFAVFFGGFPNFIVVQKDLAAFRAGVVAGSFDV